MVISGDLRNELTRQLLLAVLSLDSYNRNLGVNAQLQVTGNTIGDATVIDTTDDLAELPIDAFSVGNYGDSAF